MAADHPRPARRVVVLADLAGDDAYHVGDEAMAEATVAWLRSLAPDDLVVTVASRDPEASASRLSCAAVPWVGFADCADESARARLAAAALETTPSHPLLTAVTEADALIVAGGGNLSSMWPEHVHERALAAEVAERAGVPVVVTGQTIGPFERGPEREITARLLTTASLVGVREPHSEVEALGLGVPDATLVRAPDDAVFLDPSRPAHLPDGFDPGIDDAPNRVIAVTMHPFAPPGDHRYEALGRQLGALAERVGAQVLLVPHVRMVERPDGLTDLDVAAILADASGGTVLEAPSAREAVWASQHAWMVVSSRYHPIVFASAAAVPTLALTWGHYTSVKCRGALGHVGCEPWWVDLGAAADGLLSDAAGELARRREEVADWMSEHLGQLAAHDARRRWRIATTLGLPAGPEPPAVVATVQNRSDAPIPAGGWAATRA